MRVMTRRTQINVNNVLDMGMVLQGPGGACRHIDHDDSVKTSKSHVGVGRYHAVLPVQRLILPDSLVTHLTQR